MEVSFEVIFKFRNFETSIYRFIPGMKEAMQRELMRAQNILANMANSGIIDALNKEFKDLNPGYFENNEGKEWYDLVEYNTFMRNGYEDRICRVLNSTNASDLLGFKIGEEVNLVGYLKKDPKVEIEFFLKEA